MTFITAPGAEAWASTNMEARVCLKKSSFPEPLRDIEQHHLSSSENDISFIEQAIAHGAQEFIMKPFDAEILIGKFAQAGLL